MELIRFQMKPQFQKLVNNNNGGLSMCWIKYGHSMLVLGSSCSTCRPSSSDEQEVITSSWYCRALHV